MASARQISKRFRPRGLAFVLSFGVSLILSSAYPGMRDRISWHAQYQLCQAAAKGQTTRMRVLLGLGAQPRGWNSSYVPLLFSARNGQIPAVKLLLDRGVDVNARGEWQQTALLEAIDAGQVETAALLLSRGANPLLADDHAGTALWHAAARNQPETVKLLMLHGGRNSTDLQSALIAAVDKNETEVVKELLATGVAPAGATSLPVLRQLSRVAAANENSKIVKMLNAWAAK